MHRPHAADERLGDRLRVDLVVRALDACLEGVDLHLPFHRPIATRIGHVRHSD
jgi:hypothetical protein